jgi:hypothetical protein
MLYSSMFISFICFGGLQCVSHYYAYVAHFVFLIYVWIRTHPESCRYQLSYPISLLRHPCPYLATHLPYLAAHLPT